MSFTRLCGVAAAAVLWAGAALAQVSASGVPTIGPAPQLTFPSGGAAVLYTPSAVTFSTITSYGTFGSPLGANGGVDTPTFVMSWWMRATIGTQANQGTYSHWNIGILDTLGNPEGGATCNSEGCPGILFVPDNAGSTWGTDRLNTNPTTAGAPAFGQLTSNLLLPLGAVWHHYLWVVNTNFAAGSKRGALYLDGVKVTPTTTIDAGAAFNVAANIAAGFGFDIKTSNGSVTGAFDIADFFLDTHTTSFSGCAAIIDASNSVCAPLVAAFGATPVDIGWATNCASLTGSQPDLCFSGDKGTGGTSGGWLTNKGAATGTFALSVPPGIASVGVPRLWNAPFGPAGPPTDRPYFNWNYDANLTGLTSTTATLSLTNGGDPIVVGDLLIASVILVDTSTAFNRVITPPAGWTAISGFPIETTGTHPMNVGLFWKIAGAGDAAAGGTDWSGPAFTWTTNANALRSAVWSLSDYGGANTTSPIQAAASSTFASTATASVAPSVTPTGAPTTLLTINQFWSITKAYVPDTSEDLRHFNYDVAGSALGGVVVADEKLTTTSPAGAKTTTQSGAEASVATNIVITK